MYSHSQLGISLPSDPIAYIWIKANDQGLPSVYCNGLQFGTSTLNVKTWPSAKRMALCSAALLAVQFIVIGGGLIGSTRGSSSPNPRCWAMIRQNQPTGHRARGSGTGFSIVKAAPSVAN